MQEIGYPVMINGVVIERSSTQVGATVRQRELERELAAGGAPRTVTYQTREDGPVWRWQAAHEKAIWIAKLDRVLWQVEPHVEGWAIRSEDGHFYGTRATFEAAVRAAEKFARK